MVEEHEQGLHGQTPWLKLWRDSVWAPPQTRDRGPYQSRADGMKTDDGGLAWDALLAHPSRSVGLASTFALGVEEANDDAVPLTDKEAYRFLLRFWRMIASTYVILVSSRKEPTGSIGKPQFYA